MSYDKNNITFEPIPTNPQFIDITGQKFGRLTALGYAGTQKKQTYFWFECECGSITKIYRGSVKRGWTTSCGCFRSETTSKRVRTHGQSHTRLHDIWLGMRTRCSNPNTIGWEDYGGRGITVCERWDDFTLFAQDMGEPPTKKHSIERRDKNGNYEPSNCYWGTPIIQANNKRTNHTLTFQGRTQTLAEWSRELGFGTHTLLLRLRRGWSVEKSLTTPLLT